MSSGLKGCWRRLVSWVGSMGPVVGNAPGSDGTAGKVLSCTSAPFSATPIDSLRGRLAEKSPVTVSSVQVGQIRGKVECGWYRAGFLNEFSHS